MMRSVCMPGMHRHPPMRRSAGIEVLEERYARGEINRDEYLQKKKISRAQLRPRNALSVMLGLDPGIHDRAATSERLT